MRRSLRLTLLSGIAPVAAHAQTAPAPVQPTTPAPQQAEPATATAPTATTPTQTATPAQQQQQAASAQSSDDDEPDVVVVGSRKPPGSAIGDIPPEQSLGPSDIRSYGVSSVSDLLNELSPQTTSGRGSGGPPVILLNGRRISGFSEIRDLPTEAIARVDILPEEVALKYGYRADQKVVNFVLRRRFRSLVLEGSDKLATEGGRNTPNGTVDVLNLHNDGRFSLHTGYTSSPALYESQRDILPVTSTTTGTPTIDQRPYRTLLPGTQTLNLGAVLSQPIGKVTTTLNGTFAYTDSNSAQGLQLGGTGEPLGQHNQSLTYHLGGTAGGDVGTWRWSLTGNYDRVDSKTFTDTGNSSAGVVLPSSRGNSSSNTGEVDALVNGTLFKLPAGDIATSFRVGGSLSSLDSSSYRFGIAQSGTVTRNIVNGQVNVDVPIASRGKDVLAFLGDLSVNGNVALDHLSDFGTLKTIGYGANWSPIEGVRFLASVTDQDDAPTAAQLGNPVIVTPNVPVFDFLKGTTVNVTQTSGGNRNLIADRQHTMKLGLTIKPLKDTDLTLTANYVSAHTENAIVSFPTATAQIEAAFPGRFTRDGDGNLTAIDARPINFARTERSELRWGINFSKPLKSKVQKEIEAFRAGKGPNPFTNLAGLRSLGSQQSIFGGTVAQGFGGPGGNRQGGQGGQGGQNGQPGQSGQGAPGGTPPAANGATPPPPGGAAGGPPGGGRGFGGPGGGGGRGGFGGRGGGRLQFAIYHTWHFTDRVLVAPGGPTIDLLNGGAIGSGGQPRHEVEGQAGYINNGIGARASVNFQSGTHVDGGTIGAPTTLNFSSLTTLNLRLFFDPSSRIDFLAKHKWAAGMRVSLNISNVFDSRQRVRDATGATPVSYQPDYLDPLGRTVSLSIRKLIF